MGERRAEAVASIMTPSPSSAARRVKFDGDYRTRRVILDIYEPSPRLFYTGCAVRVLCWALLEA